jgi:hypothetical protein
MLIYTHKKKPFLSSTKYVLATLLGDEDAYSNEKHRQKSWCLPTIGAPGYHWNLLSMPLNTGQTFMYIIYLCK